jgi:hypothetical protein
MNIRLKILCILFGIAFFYVVGESFIRDFIPNFTAGFTAGFKAGRERGNKEANRLFEKETESEQSQSEIFHFYIKPQDGSYSFPTTLLNLRTGRPIQAEFFIASVKAENVQFSAWLMVGHWILLILAFPFLFLALSIPILTYKVIRSIVKNEIFELQNIQRIRRIGYFLLILFVLSVYASFISVAEAQSAIRLENYKITFSIQGEYYWLLFGLVTLLFAEILKISHTMKEEQDLTV